MEEIVKNYPYAQMGATGIFFVALMYAVVALMKLYTTQNDKTLAILQEAMKTQKEQLTENLKTINEFAGKMRDVAHSVATVTGIVQAQIESNQDGQERIITALGQVSGDLNEVRKQLSLMTTVLIKLAKMSPEEVALETVNVSKSSIPH